MSTPGDIVVALVNSENAVAAGIGQCVQAFLTAVNTPPNGPIFLEFGDRQIAVGRKRMTTMSGRNAFTNLKGKLGLLHATTPLYLQAQFFGDTKFVEVDLDSWEDLIPYVARLRIVT